MIFNDKDLQNLRERRLKSVLEELVDSDCIVFTSFEYGVVALDLIHNQAYSIAPDGTVWTAIVEFDELLRVSKFPPAHYHMNSVVDCSHYFGGTD